MNNLHRVSHTAGQGDRRVTASADQFQSPHIPSTLHCPLLHQHSCHSGQVWNSSSETSFRARTFHFSKHTFLYICFMLDTARVHIQSYLPNASNLQKGMEPEGNYSATRETGLSITTEASKMTGVGQVRNYFKII